MLLTVRGGIVDGSKHVDVGKVLILGETVTVVAPARLRPGSRLLNA